MNKKEQLWNIIIYLSVLRINAQTYLKFVTSTTSGAGVKIFRPVSKKCESVCFSVKIMNFELFGVKKSGIGVFLVSVENGVGVKKMTNFRYDYSLYSLFSLCICMVYLTAVVFRCASISCFQVVTN